jgi:hypothetical protein
MIRAERQRIKSVHIEERGETSSVEAEDLSRSSGSPQTLDHLLIGLSRSPRTQPKWACGATAEIGVIS